MSKVYFFATCVGSAVYADTCVNAIKLLQDAGVEVIFKKDQTCCGQPSFNSGYYEESRKIALHNIKVFEGDYPIVTISGSCAGVMRKDYEELFEGRPEIDEVRKFQSRMYELSEYLDSVLQVKYDTRDMGEKIKVTWHSNCHALRVAKCIPSAKNILRSLSNVELIELEREEECCGFGGTFAVKEPELNEALVTNKIADIKSRDVDILLAADAGCLLNISGAMKKQGYELPTMHFYDFLAKRIQIA
ncbi:oxidoreductase [Helicobacter sp. 13S00401-1]|uniref:(Fe-S)-binding protein n=1 Tax=Helicobacter sp. 13S00401-1 TaxID=1905758 RepID=UPI000BA61D50|nr:(Fe-S)-binding protein [Helicobacter sp. 13S00401-1]PAF50239.1 oxidoreductase [Helicobacter sp. 13S00401-1]